MGGSLSRQEQRANKREKDAFFKNMLSSITSPCIFVCAREASDEAYEKILGDFAKNPDVKDYAKHLVFECPKTRDRYNHLMAHVNLKDIQEKITRLHDVIRIIYPELGEAYDNMPKKYFENGNVKSVFDIYFDKLALISTGTYLFSSDRVAGGMPHLCLLTIFELKRIYPDMTYQQYADKDCYAGRLVNMDFFPQNERQRVTKIEDVDGKALAEARAKQNAAYSKMFKDDESLNGSVANLRNIFYSIEHGAEKPMSYGARIPRKEIRAANSAVANAMYGFFNYMFQRDEKIMTAYTDGVNLHWFTPDDLGAASIIAHYHSIPLSDSIMIGSLCRNTYSKIKECEVLRETLTNKDDVIGRNEETIASLTKRIEKMKNSHVKDIERVKEDAKRAAEHASKKQPIAAPVKIDAIPKEEYDKLKTAYEKAEERAKHTEYLQEELVKLQRSMSEFIEQHENDAPEEDTEENDYESIAKSIGVTRTPYRIYVIGGHDRWMNNMQALFPDVKFLPREKGRFDPEALNGVECIWVQTASLPHSVFEKVIKEADRRSIPVSYFHKKGVKSCSGELKDYLDLI